MVTFHGALLRVMYVLLDASEFVKIRPSNPVGVKGQSITLNCSAVGNPSSVYEWRGGKRTAGSTLELHHLNFRMKGHTHVLLVTRLRLVLGLVVHQYS